ncbi:hypothetical protein GCM10010222_76810 [Streptomyces tanashiensis]|nr:hypothetical protein GCM10010222_76810 [Streptomyces tanashiensis]GGY58164.1 hypothetical protein GCM10010299_75840 [Streptomyces tanashiensis]
MPEPRDRPLKMRSPGRDALLARRLLCMSGVVVAICFSGLRGPYGVCGLLAAVHRMPGPAPSREERGPDPAGGQDRVGTIARTLAAISAGSGA